VVIPPEQNATAEYPAAVLRDAPNPGAARAFVAALTEPAAQALLRTAGFGPP
jgi:molybdate transport system substrate-binding protein